MFFSSWIEKLTKDPSHLGEIVKVKRDEYKIIRKLALRYKIKNTGKCENYIPSGDKYVDLTFLFQEQTYFSRFMLLLVRNGGLKKHSSGRLRQE